MIFPTTRPAAASRPSPAASPAEARQVVVAQLDLFPGDYPIVVPSGSCAGMIRWHWEKVIGDDPALAARAAAIAGRTFEFAEFLLACVGFKRPDGTKARRPPSPSTPPARPAARWAPCWSAANCWRPPGQRHPRHPRPRIRMLRFRRQLLAQAPRTSPPRWSATRSLPR